MASHTIAQTQRRFATDVDLSSLELSAELARAANGNRNRLEQGVLADTKITYSGFIVLWIIWAWQPIETNAIAVEAGLGKAALSGVLNTLEKRKLIERRKSKSDGRIIEVSLTLVGLKLFESVFPKVYESAQVAFERIQPGNRALLLDTLRSLGND